MLDRRQLFLFSLAASVAFLVWRDDVKETVAVDNAVRLSRTQSGAAMVVQKPRPSPIGIFFVGNSYTHYHDLPNTLQNMAASGGYVVEVDHHTPGGTTLEGHLKQGEVERKLRSRKAWDFVFVQEQSVVPAVPAWRESMMYPAARTLHKLIRELNATTVFYMTWGRQWGLPEYQFANYSQMQTAVYDGYMGIQQELAPAGARMAPVGAAWRTVLAERPELHASMWSSDGTHPSPLGSYLAAAVMYSTIFGESTAPLTFIAPGVSAEDAAFLRRVADETVFGNRALWNLGGSGAIADRPRL